MSEIITLLAISSIPILLFFFDSVFADVPALIGLMIPVIIILIVPVMSTYFLFNKSRFLLKNSLWYVVGGFVLYILSTIFQSKFHGLVYILLPLLNFQMSICIYWLFATFKNRIFCGSLIYLGFTALLFGTAAFLTMPENKTELHEFPMSIILNYILSFWFVWFGFCGWLFNRMKNA